MAIQQLPGIGDYLLQVLPMLGKNLASIATPMQQNQQQFLGNIVNNPQMLDAYVLANRANPMLGQALNVAPFLESAGLTQPTQQRLTLGEQEIQRGSLQLKEGERREGFNQQMADALRGAGVPEEVINRAAQSYAYGRTQADVEKEDVQLVGLREGTRKLVNEVAQYFEGLGTQFDVQKFLSGKYTGEEYNALMESQGPAIKLILDYLSNREAMANQRQIAGMRISQGQDEAMLQVMKASFARAKDLNTRIGQIKKQLTDRRNKPNKAVLESLSLELNNLYRELYELGHSPNLIVTAIDDPFLGGAKIKEETRTPEEAAALGVVPRPMVDVLGMTPQQLVEQGGGGFSTVNAGGATQKETVAPVIPPALPGADASRANVPVAPQRTDTVENIVARQPQTPGSYKEEEYVTFKTLPAGIRAQVRANALASGDAAAVQAIDAMEARIIKEGGVSVNAVAPKPSRDYTK